MSDWGDEECGDSCSDRFADACGFMILEEESKKASPDPDAELLSFLLVVDLVVAIGIGVFADTVLWGVVSGIVGVVVSCVIVYGSNDSKSSVEKARRTTKQANDPLWLEMLKDEKACDLAGVILISVVVFALIAAVISVIRL